MERGGPVPGWYPDPAGGRRRRWWDGAAWTEHTEPPPPLDDEAAAARWARAALLAAAPAQIVSTLLLRGGFRRLIDTAPELFDASSGASWFGQAEQLTMEVLGAVTTATAILFLIWFARSAHNARALGLPARREPAAAVAGFLVPIINLWWPYQSTCDLAPDDDATRRLVLRWFLLWMVGGFAGAVITVVSLFVDSWVGWALLAVPAVLVTLAALAARQVVSTMVRAHEALA